MESHSRLVAALSPVLEELLKLEVESLAEHLSLSLKIEKNEAKQAISDYFESKKAPVENKLVDKGSGITIITNFSSVSFAVVGDIEPLKDYFHKLKLLKYRTDLKIGSGFTGPSSKLKTFIKNIETEGITYTIQEEEIKKKKR